MCLNYIWEWSIHYGLLSSPHHMNQELLEKYACKVATMKIWWCHVPQLLSETEVSIALVCQLFNLLHSKNCLKSTSVIRVANGQFLITQRKPSHATTKLMLFTTGKDEWNTKEDTGKSLKNALHILQYAKRHLSGWSDVKQRKNQACSHSHYWVTLVWRHQAVG